MNTFLNGSVNALLMFSKHKKKKLFPNIHIDLTRSSHSTAGLGVMELIFPVSSEVRGHSQGERGQCVQWDILLRLSTCKLWLILFAAL